MIKRNIQISLLTLLMVVCGSPTTAFAHAQLINTIPNSNQIIQTFPSKILLEFGEEMLDFKNGNLISVSDPTGKEITTGPTVVAGPMIYVDLMYSEVIGEYQVTYRAISNDGHKVEGSYSFYLKLLEDSDQPGKTSKQNKTNKVATPSVSASSIDESHTYSYMSFISVFWHHHAFHLILTIGFLGFIGVWALYRKFNN